MAELKITFKLGDEDLQHLRRAMAEAAEAARHQSEEDVIDAAFAIARHARASDPPQFVQERIEALEVIATMMRDREYALPATVRRRILSALAYFANPAGLIPDQAPVVGFLDDAIMIEIVAQEFRDEIKAYRDFCRYRGNAVQRHAAEGQRASLDRELNGKRKELRAWIQERRNKAEDRARLRGRFFKLW